MWEIRQSQARSILTPTSGFIKQAGFTHSLTPARNCTYGCTYCYVPTMRVYGGLQKEDWRHWGQFTTVKENAPELIKKEIRPGHVIYCSPLVDPYQPTEREHPIMPGILEAAIAAPPAVFAIQTRGTLILRDIDLLQRLARKTKLRVSFSITTDDEGIRKRYEPHCEPIQIRLQAIAALRRVGVEVYATLAPLLPCDPERLANLALDASMRSLIGDPLHVRATKQRGATTRTAGIRLAETLGDQEWLNPEFQADILSRIQAASTLRGFPFAWGPKGFSRLAIP